MTAKHAALPLPSALPGTDIVSPWKRGSEKERERELKREAVLRTAARAFIDKGLHAAALDEVAARLHVTRPTLYDYFKNKDEILFECVRLGLQMLRGRRRPRVGRSAHHAFTLASALSCIARRYRPDGELSADALAERCIDVLLHGVAPRTPPPKRRARAAAA